LPSGRGDPSQSILALLKKCWVDSQKQRGGPFCFKSGRGDPSTLFFLYEFNFSFKEKTRCDRMRKVHVFYQIELVKLFKSIKLDN